MKIGLFTDSLSEMGFDKQSLYDNIKKVRSSGISGPIRNERYNDAYLYFTSNLSEKPINIVVRKDVLVRLADNIFIVSKDGIKIKK